MSHYLDRLCGALTARDAAAIRQLLGDPLAASLPVTVRAEAAALAEHPDNPARAPLQAFVFAHRMAQLMAATGRPEPTTAQAPRDARVEERHEAARPPVERRTRRATAA
jgi:hypothetical protein